MSIKRIWLLVPLLSGCASPAISPSSISPLIQIPVEDAQRHPCEIVPFYSEKDLSALTTAKDAKAFFQPREVAHNEALGECNLRGEALVKSIDAANARLKALAERK